MNAERVRTIREQAVLLARENKRSERGITKVYWFPDEREVRLIELEEGIPPTPGEDVEPFRFAASPEDQLMAPSGVALIRPDEFGKLNLPDDWGGWEAAQELPVEDLESPQ